MKQRYGRSACAKQHSSLSTCAKQLGGRSTCAKLRNVSAEISLTFDTKLGRSTMDIRRRREANGILVSFGNSRSGSERPLIGFGLVWFFTKTSCIFWTDRIRENRVIFGHGWIFCKSYK